MDRKESSNIKGEHLLQARRNHRRWVFMVIILGVLVTSGTFMALSRSAVARTYQKQVLDCRQISGTVSHVHNDDCYYNGELVCPLQEIPPHRHTSECWQEEPVLVCGLEENDGHWHSDDCFAPVMELACGMEESAGDETHPAHQHSPACYRPMMALVCGLEEIPGDETHVGHRHTDACFEEVRELACGMEEGEGAHYHTDACWGTQQVLICGQAELPVHVHGQECFRMEEMTEEEIAAMQLVEAANASGNTNNNITPDETQESGDTPKEGQTSENATSDTIPAGDTIPVSDIIPASDTVPASDIKVVPDENTSAPENTQESESASEGETAALPMQTEPFHFASRADDILVTVDAPAEVFPAGTEMKVRAVYDEKVLGEMADAVEGNVVHVQAVDISFWYGGKEIEPMQPIRVVMTPLDVPDFDEQTVVHVDDMGSAAVIEQENVAEPEAAFEVDTFSVYGLVYTKIETTVLASDGNNYKITVTAPDDAPFPEKAKLWASEVEAGANAYGITYNEYLIRSEYALGWESGSATYVRLFDIFVGDEFGNKLSLTTPVDVKIVLLDKETEIPSSVVHFGTKTEVVESETAGQTVSFEASSFSIYAIVENDGVVVPRRTYHFVRLDEETGALVPYYFYNSAGEAVDNQIIKNGDELQPINTPYIPDEETWDGWRVVNITGYDPKNTSSQNYTSLSYGREVVFGEPLTVTQDEDIYIIPYFGQYHIATFIDYLFEGSKVTGYLIHNREEVPLGTTYDTTVQTVPNHKAVGGAEEADLVFVGWRLLHDESEMAGYFNWTNGVLTLKDGVTWDDVDPTDTPDGHAVPGVTRDANNFVISIVMDPDTSRNYVLLPVYEYAHWVEYYSGPTGSGATYVAPVHVGVGQSLAAAGAQPTVDMTWRGYEFQYWTTGNPFDDNGNPIEYASGKEPARFDFGDDTTNKVKLNSDLKLYAYWKKSGTTYTVMYWRQQLSDDKNLTDDEKHYDYAGQRTGTAIVGSTVTLTTADQNMEVQRYNDEYLKYVGFHYAKDDAATKTVNANGSTVINVYYDRNLITMNFDRDIDSYTATDATEGTLYGLVNGEYVALTWNGSEWTYTTTEPRYVDYTGTRYDTTNNNYDTQYGVSGGRVVQLHYHQRNKDQHHWSTNQNHSRGDGYEGTRYVENANGAYGFVNGQMIQLTNGQYQNGTQEVVHVYTGSRYSKTTTRSFTGLFGQQLGKYGYRWPFEYVWRYEDNQSTNYNTHYTGMTYLGEFVLPEGVRDADGKIINLSTNGSATNYYEFYLQDPELTDLTDPASYILSATGSGYSADNSTTTFYLSEKYEGYAVYGYRRYTGSGSNKSYVDNNIVLGSVGTEITTHTARENTFYNVEVYYRVYSYNVTYKDPITREILSEETFNYGADIDSGGAPAKATVESHVPVGYRLMTDGDGNIIWYADPSHEVEFNFDRTMPNHDLEVFPGFEIIWYWIKIEPNGGQLSETESTWFWKSHGDTTVKEYTDAVREYAEDHEGTWYYHYDEFNPDTELNTAGGTERKAYYTQDASLSSDGKTYSPSTRYSLDGWYEVTIDETTGEEVLLPYRFGSPVTHNTTLRAVWISTGAYATVYKNEGVDASGNPLYVYTDGDNKTHLVTKTSTGSGDTYTYPDENGDPVTITDQTVIDGLTRLTGSNAPTGGRTYKGESGTIILHRPDPPEGYVCTGYYFNGKVYIPGNVFKIQSDLDGADGDIDMQFTFYPIYEPISERDVKITNIYFSPNVSDLSTVTVDSSLQDYYEDEYGNRYDAAADGLIQKQSVDTAAKTVAFLNRQVNANLTLLGEGTFTREGYTLKGWSLSPGENNRVDFQPGQENVGADNLSREGNTDANTLYAVWEINKYNVTVEKIVESNWKWDRYYRFTFAPDFTGMTGITTELQTNFTLTGDAGLSSHIKTFGTKVPYGTQFSVTETDTGLWAVSVSKQVTRDDRTVQTEAISNGQMVTVTGDTKLIFTNTMAASAKVVLYKMNENASSEDATSENLGRQDPNRDKILSGAVFTLLRKEYASSPMFEAYRTGISIDSSGYEVLELPQGYYRLVETSSPDGYLIQTKSWEFWIDYYGNVYAESQPDLVLNRSSNASSEVPNRVMIVVNHPGSALPMTGGTGTVPFLLGGSMLVLVSALLYMLNLRRRKETD